jgi:hypothetical protein
MTTFGDMVYGLGGIPLIGSLGSGPNLLGAKTVYFVEGNAGSDSNEGKNGWGDAFKTLAKALAVSQADISSGAFGWAARNVILCRGDYLEEDLVLLAQKTDVVGCGSWDAFPMCGLVGNHVPIGASSAYGTRFFNFKFMGDLTTGGDIFTLSSAVANLTFVNCQFSANSTTPATGAIVATASTHLHVLGCEFLGKFSDAVIELGTGLAWDTKIIGNHIEGDNQGINIGSGATCADGGTETIVIANNTFNTGTECIDDEASIANIWNNTCVTRQAKGTAGAGVVIGNTHLAAGNKLSASDLANANWPAYGTL